MLAISDHALSIFALVISAVAFGLTGERWLSQRLARRHADVVIMMRRGQLLLWNRGLCAARDVVVAFTSTEIKNDPFVFNPFPITLDDRQGIKQALVFTLMFAWQGPPVTPVKISWTDKTGAQSKIVNLNLI